MKNNTDVLIAEMRIKMTIMIYRWQSNSEKPFITEMEKLGIRVVSFEKPICDYHADAVFAQAFLSRLHSERIDVVFSFDYFPIISSLCEINHIPYFSWIYDCPLYTLTSKTLSNGANYIFCFDKVYTMRLQERGAKHCYHFPLGVSLEYFGQETDKTESGGKTKFACDISFVGNFYNGEKNRLRQAELSNYARGYVEGLMAAQEKVYGYNFIAEALAEDVVTEIAEKCKLSLGMLYDYEPRQLVADTVGMELSARERERVIAAAAEVSSVVVYTGSALPTELETNGNVMNKGYADNERDMPLIFNESKINLNITSRTIESGIPQRVFDILACGGFCLTNYQPEIAEYFEDGRDLVMYSSMEDLQEKIAYYLTNKEERSRIARNGMQKIKQHFTLEQRLGEMLQMVLE